MAGMRAPSMHEVPVPVVSDEILVGLLKARSGRETSTSLIRR
jgi:hypothetical protein